MSNGDDLDLDLDPEIRKKIREARGSYDQRMQSRAKSGSGNPLEPERRQQGELFALDLLEYAIKDDHESMDLPLFCVSPSLKKLVDYKWISPDGSASFAVQEISKEGRPLQRDKDVIIYVISQLIEMHNRGLEINTELVHKVKMTAHDYLRVTNKATGKKEYDQLEKTLDRLAGFRFKLTRVQPNGKEITKNYSFLSGYTAHRLPKKAGRKSGRLEFVEIELSSWLVEQIVGNRYLTISPDYFRLKSGLDRRLYEIARKGCGSKAKWSIGLEKLRIRTGTRANLKEFTRELRAACKSDHIPDYRFVVGAMRATKETKVYIYPKNNVEAAKQVAFDIGKS